MKKLMFIILSFVLLLQASQAFAGSYLRTEIPLAGATMLPAKMHAMVLGPVYAEVDKSVDDCRKFHLTDTKITKPKTNVEYGRNGREIAGTWSEVWIVDACGTPVSVPIDFTIRGKGVKFDIKPLQ